MAKLYKSIAYAYATSSLAEKLGYGKEGCFYVEQRAMNEVGMWRTYAAHNGEGYLKSTDADLLSFFKETDGVICPMFLRHGNQDALNALKAQAPAC